VANYLTMASKKADSQLGHNIIDFRPALDAAKKFQQAGSKMLSRQINATDPVRMNRALCETERALLIPGGLPNRPWYRHAIYAPGVYTGYAAVVIPGINEAIDQKNASEVTQQVALLVDALHRAAKTLEKY
jgi:N-acetylated-alpha-linked acidic dipeptidase